MGQAEFIKKEMNASSSGITTVGRQAAKVYILSSQNAEEAVYAK